MGFSTSVEGYLVISYGGTTYKMFCEKFQWKRNMKTQFYHLPDDDHFGVDLGERWFTFRAQNVWITDYDDLEDLIADLETFQDNTFTIKFERDTVPNYIKFDGTNTSETVRFKNGYEVIVEGQGTLNLFRIPILELEQVG